MGAVPHAGFTGRAAGRTRRIAPVLAMGCALLAGCAATGFDNPPPPPPPPPPEERVLYSLPPDEMDGAGSMPMFGAPSRDRPLATATPPPRATAARPPGQLRPPRPPIRRPRPSLPDLALGTAASRPPPGAQAAAPPTTGAADGMCAVTQDFERAGDCERFAAQLEAVREGRHAFRPEQPMVRGRPSVVRYAIARLPEAVQQGRGSARERAAAVAATDAQLRGEIVREGEQGAVRSEATAVGRMMYACLAGDASFTIEPAGCIVVDTLENPAPVWRWEVTPQRAGEGLKLTLTSGIEVRNASGETRRIGHFSRSEDIDVTVSTAGRRDDLMSENESWIRSPLGVLAAITALVGAIAALIAALRALHRRDGKGMGAAAQPSQPAATPTQTSAAPPSADST